MSKEVIVGVVSALVTAAVFYALGFVEVRTSGSLPTGAVMAFNRTDCDLKGWRDFEGAKGRFIIGSDSQIGVGKQGGNSEVVLSVTQMPAHSHQTTMNQARLSAASSRGTWVVALDDRADQGTITLEFSANERKADPVNLLPPYVALKFCEKE